ncbi:hypothetical protein AAFC00_006759 [Neodothiora populina]|uniref:Vps72/YL1 C-terminal domain-containing protein n=1 Tax=Neodothiora populina TaxID=2781224 RepID=A0ABR3PB20_9PEZI
MAPITTASDENTHMALLDKLDMHKIHKPFRNPNWKPPQRRNKTLKQVISEAQRKEQSLLATQNNSGATTPLPADANAVNANDLSRAVLEKNMQQNQQTQAQMQPQQTFTVPSYTYTSIAAAPSFKPKLKYCDLTGLPAPYQDPKTGLRYHNSEIYAVLKTLSTTQVQEYLAARGANTVLK